MTEKEYRQHPAISRSQLWRLRESPEKFHYYEDNPQPPTPALLFGQVVHKLLLQPEDFESEFVVKPDFDRRTKKGRQEYNDWYDVYGGKTEVSEDMYQQAAEMTAKALSEPYVAKLLSGEHEKPYFWTDELTGEACKCRVDAITEIGGKLVIVDYKTTNSAANEDFQRDAIKFGYDMQAAMYSEGVKLNTGRDVSFVFIVQEKAPPYAVNIFEADELLVKRGYDVFRELLGIYHYCRTRGNWYGYLGQSGIINTLSLPAWLAKEIE